MSILAHNEHENILLDVKRLKLQGLTARRIAAELDRLGYKKPCKTVTWQTHHVLNLIKELRRRGEIPPIGKFKEQFQASEQKISCHYPKY